LAQPKKRPQNRRRRNPESRSLSAIQGGPRSTLTPNTPYLFERQLADVTVFVDGANTLQIKKAPGFLGELPFISGTATADTFTNTYFASFGWSMPMNAISSTALISCFRQWRPESVALKFQYLGTQALAVAATTQLGTVLPEVLISSEPVNQSPAPDPTYLESYQGTKNMVLSQFRSLTHEFVPRTAYAVGAGGAAQLNNQKQFWYDTDYPSGVDLVFNGADWILRNMSGGNAASSAVRITAHLRFSCRVPAFQNVFTRVSAASEPSPEQVSAAMAILKTPSRKS